MKDIKKLSSQSSLIGVSFPTFVTISLYSDFVVAILSNWSLVSYRAIENRKPLIRVAILSNWSLVSYKTQLWSTNLRLSRNPL